MLKNNFNNRRSFTLLEMVIVSVIVVTLAGIALPSFHKAQERALQRQALANLRLLGAAERAYISEYTTFSECTCDTFGTGGSGCDNVVNGCNYIFKVNLIPKDWKYGVIGTAGAGNAYDVWAARIGGSTCTYGFTDSGVQITTGNCQ